jgi:enoyl-CoA hydratase
MTDVLVSCRGQAAIITLNRPQALNALTLDMVRAIDAALDDFAADDAVGTVVIDGAGTRGLCSGGDIRALYEAAKSGDPMPRDFWREEYALNARIARFTKPVVAIMYGIVMGGGIGLAAHASHRVATPSLRTAMPEVGIGFAPDVGGTWLLSRAPGELGTHAALTGGNLGAGDALLCGLADVILDEDNREALLTALATTPATEAIALVSREPQRQLPATLDAQRGWIDSCYGADDVETIVARLSEHSNSGAQQAAAAIAGKSPTSLKVTLRELRTARRLPDLEACLEQEYRVSCAFLDHPDFVEGIRAAVVDKDRTPRWSPATLAAVTTVDVDRFFAAVEAVA